MVTIVPESPEHVEAIRQLTIAAFTESEFGHNGEADLIDSIRDQSQDTLSLVAIDAGDVVGHILFSPINIRKSNGSFSGMGLAPMSVLPAFQRTGIGTMLVEESLRLLDIKGTTYTIVAGHPGFYPRFGFVPAKEFGLVHGFDGMPQDILFVRTGPEANEQQTPDGLIYYHSAFGPQHDGSPKIG